MKVKYVRKEMGMVELKRKGQQGEKEVWKREKNKEERKN